MNNYEKEIKTLEVALAEHSETLNFLVSILNNSDNVKALLIKKGVSVPFITINHTCGRNDRNVKHLKEAWMTHFAKPKMTNVADDVDDVISYEEFALSMRYELTVNMPLDELGHYHSQMGLDEDTELDVSYRALLLYKDDRYIMQHHDGSFELILGNQIFVSESYTSADFTDMQMALYDFYKSEVSDD